MHPSSFHWPRYSALLPLGIGAPTSQSISVLRLPPSVQQFGPARPHVGADLPGGDTDHSAVQIEADWTEISNQKINLGPAMRRLAFRLMEPGSNDCRAWL